MTKIIYKYLTATSSYVEVSQCAEWIISLCEIDDFSMQGGLFCFCAAMASNVSLLAGMYYKRCTFLLPYFFIAMLFIISLVLHLFISILNTANTKDTLQPGTLLKNLTVFGILCFEGYTILSVWRVFVYICDARMDHDVKSMFRAKIAAKRLQRLGRRTEGELIAVIIGGDSEG
ncbi:unnamed protein product [Angiostrongylus costaricensis]|uniref:DUF4220 domain-containing protein n=1 Tax=Angiostrongylus costaricensis TaxID=334426 RepID=A0A0R3PSZ4_ANGCS|nr:unnamed protein product [Angiostrongylus costaricensis]